MDESRTQGFTRPAREAPCGSPGGGRRIHECGTSATSWSASVRPAGKRQGEGSSLRRVLRPLLIYREHGPRNVATCASAGLCGLAVCSRVWDRYCARCVGVQSGLHPHTGQGCLTKWIQPTRLETRTKESNICASILVLGKLKTCLQNTR